MIRPRNSLVVCRLIEQQDQKVGQITVPAAEDYYCEAEVVAVGPGSIGAEGGRSETFDLKPGQRVYVKHKQRHPSGAINLVGVRYIDNDEIFCIFEQTSILGIVADTSEMAKPKLARVN